MLDKLTIWTARAEARAALAYSGEVEFIDSVDSCWDLAEQAGLIAELGADRVQEILAEVFARNGLDLDFATDEPVGDLHCDACGGPCSAPWFCESVETHVAARGQPETRVAEPRPTVAASTVEAFAFVVRQRDPERLRQWLARRPDAAVTSLFSTLKAAA